VSAKRVFDIVVALLGLLLLAPLLLILGLLIRFRLGAPVFFTQIRPGLHGQPFKLIKFRTMTNQRDAAGRLLPDERRLPPLWSLAAGHQSR